MKFMERERKLAIILQKKIYMYAKTKKKLISKKAQKTEWSKSPSVTGRGYHYYSILERKNEI
jgi:hypothetical protein